MTFEKWIAHWDRDGDTYPDPNRYTRMDMNKAYQAGMAEQREKDERIAKGARIGATPEGIAAAIRNQE